jgi:hypothetical protein
MSPRQTKLPKEKTPIPVHQKFRLNDLPVPEAYKDRGAQVFGREVVGWGTGEKGAQDLIDIIKNNPERTRKHIESWKSHGLTAEMAREWATGYKRVAGMEPGGSKVFSKRAELMPLIVDLLSAPDVPPGAPSRWKFWRRSRR